MTNPTAQVVAAAWYEDPSDPELVRWWNGIAWTDHTQAKPASASSTPDIEQLSPAAGHDAGHDRASAVSTTPGGAAPITMSAQMLGWSPLLFLAVAILVIALSLYVTSSPAVWLMMLAPYALSIFWAVRDSRALGAAGLRAPAWGWAVGGPLVYLIARQATVRGWGALATHLSIVVAGGVALGVLSATGLTAPFELAIRIQSEIRDDLVGSGVASNVVCPFVTESMTAGSLYTCDATLVDGTNRSLIVSIDTDAGDFSYSFR